MAVRGTRGSLKETAASKICFMSPFACFDDFASQNDFTSSSKDGVLSSSIEATLGGFIGLFLGVEHDG